MAKKKKKATKSVPQNEVHKQLILRGGRGAGKHHNRSLEVRNGRRRKPKHAKRDGWSSSDHMRV